MVNLTPLTDSNIRTVLQEWEEDINKLSTHNLSRNDAGLPRPQFSRSGHEPYYGYPDVWDVSQVTDMSRLFEGKNLQKLFIRPRVEFIRYRTRDNMQKKYGTNWTKWMTYEEYDPTHFNDGPVANVSKWIDRKGDETEYQMRHYRMPRVFFLHMWDMSNVRNTTRMFKDAIFNMNVFNWNFDNLECGEEMFLNTKFFSTPIKFHAYGNLSNLYKENLINWIENADKILVNVKKQANDTFDRPRGLVLNKNWQTDNTENTKIKTFFKLLKQEAIDKKYGIKNDGIYHTSYWDELIADITKAKKEIADIMNTTNILVNATNEFNNIRSKTYNALNALNARNHSKISILVPLLFEATKTFEYVKKLSKNDQDLVSINYDKFIEYYDKKIRQEYNDNQKTLYWDSRLHYIAKNNSIFKYSDENEKIFYDNECTGCNGSTSTYDTATKSTKGFSNEIIDDSFNNFLINNSLMKRSVNIRNDVDSIKVISSDSNDSDTYKGNDFLVIQDINFPDGSTYKINSNTGDVISSDDFPDTTGMIVIDETSLEAGYNNINNQSDDVKNGIKLGVLFGSGASGLALWQGGRGLKQTSALLEASKTFGNSKSMAIRTKELNSMWWKKSAKKFSGGVLIGVALNTGYSLLQNDIDDAVRDSNNPNEPPGNPFAFEDPRQLANLPGKSPDAIMYDIVCVGGGTAAGFIATTGAGVALDLLCYAWDHINYAINNKMWRNNTEPNLTDYIHYTTSNAISGTGENFKHIQGDYVSSQFYQFQATTLFSNEKGREPPQGVFITPKYRGRNEYHDNGILKNQDNDFKLTDKSTQPFGDDLDYRVQSGNMRKKGPYYIWLENYERMHNGDGENTYQGDFGPWNTTASRYIFLRTNISKCLSSWSIRQKDYLTTVVSRNKKGKLSNATIIDQPFSTIKYDSTSLELPGHGNARDKVNKQALINATNKLYLLQFSLRPDQNAINNAKAEVDAAATAVNNPDKNIYNLFSMKNMFQGAITDKALFEPVNFSNNDLPFIGDDKTAKDAQALNKLADKMALINLVPEKVTYKLYDPLNKFNKQETSYDGLRWNLSGFSDLSYFFANIRVCFKYGEAYKYWLDVGSSPASSVSLPHSDRTKIIEEQYITHTGDGNPRHFGIFIPYGNYYHNSQYPQSMCDIYKLRDEMNIWEYSGREGTSINTPQPEGSLSPIPQKIKFKFYMNKEITENNKLKKVPLPLQNDEVRRNNITNLIWGEDEGQPGTGQLVWEDQDDTKKQLVIDIINNKNNTWENKRNLVCKTMAEQGKISYQPGKNKDNVNLDDYYKSVRFVETTKVHGLGIHNYSELRIKMCKIIVESIKPNGSLPEIDWKKIERDALDREILRAIRIRDDGPNGWNKGKYVVLKEYDIEVIANKQTLDLSRANDWALGYSKPAQGCTAFNEGVVLTNRMKSNYNTKNADHRLHPSMKTGIDNDRVKPQPLEVRILLCLILWDFFGDVHWLYTWAILNAKMYRISAEIYYWDHVRNEWDLSHNTLTSNLYSFVGKLPITYYKVDENDSSQIDDTNPITKDKITSFFSNRRFVSVRNMRNMFEGCSFSYGYENFYMILEDIVNMWNLTPYIKRDLTELFVNSDFFHISNDSLSELDVRNLCVDTLFGHFDSTREYNNDVWLRNKRVPEQWSDKNSLIQSNFASNNENNILAIYAKMLITDTTYKQKFNVYNDETEEAESIKNKENLENALVEVDYSTMFKDNNTTWKLTWSYKAFTVYHKFVGLEKAGNPVKYIKYPLTTKEDDQIWNLSKSAFIKATDEIISLLRKDLGLFGPLYTNNTFLETNTIDDITELFRSMKLPEIQKDEYDEDHIYITYYEFMIWYKNKIVFNNDSDLINNLKYTYFDKIPEKLIVNSTQLDIIVDKYILYKQYFNSDIWEVWNNWKLFKTKPNKDGLGGGVAFWYNSKIKSDYDDEKTNDQGEVVEKKYYEHINPTWINPNRLKENNSLITNIKNIDTSKVIFVNGLFKNFKDFDIDISNWSFSSIPPDFPNAYINIFSGTQVKDRQTLITIIDKFCIYPNALLKIMGLDRLDTSLITDMSYLFQHNRAISFSQRLKRNSKNIYHDNGNIKSYGFNFDISNWDVSNVTNMESMFEGCDNFNINISNWHVSNVTNMKNMFKGCKKFNQNLIKWDTKNVTTIERIFEECENLDKIGIMYWNTKKVENVSNCFLKATKMETLFDGKNIIGNIQFNITNFNDYHSGYEKNYTKEQMNVDIPDFFNRYFFFKYYFVNTAEYTKHINTYKTNKNYYYNTGPIANWNTINVTDMSDSFNFSTTPNERLKNFNEKLGHWNTSNVTNMKEMFKGCKKFNEDISRWNTSNVANMSYMFYDCEVFNQDLSNWNTSITTDMSYMFYNCKEFNIDLYYWSVGCVNDMDHMFYNCEMFDPDLSIWNIENVTNMSYMFYNCINFNNNIFKRNILTTSKSDNTHYKEVKSKLEKVDYMFYNCIKFNRDISEWNTSNVTNMEYMFYNCINFNCNIGTKVISKNIKNIYWKQDDSWELYDYSYNKEFISWNVENVTNMNDMLYNCQNFNQNITLWDVSKVKNMNNILYNTIRLDRQYLKYMENEKYIENKIYKQAVYEKDKTYVLFNDSSKPCGEEFIGPFKVDNIDEDEFILDNILYIRSNDIDVDENNKIITKKDNVYKLVNNYINRSNKYLFFKYTIKPDKNNDNYFIELVNTYLNIENNKNTDNNIDYTTYGYISNWNTINVTNMDELFNNKDDFNEDISKWDTSNVTSMKKMFYYAKSFDADIRSWDISKIGKDGLTDIFKEANNINNKYFKFAEMYLTEYLKLYTDTNVDTKNLNPLNEYLQYDNRYFFFKYILQNKDKNSGKLTSIRDTLDDYLLNENFKDYGPISNWNVSNVEDMNLLFKYININNDFSEYTIKEQNGLLNRDEINTILEKKLNFNEDLSEWDVSNVKYMNQMFWRAEKFNSDIRSWDVSNVESMINMFYNANEFDQDIRKWNVNKAIIWTSTDGGMFRNASKFRSTNAHFYKNIVPIDSNITYYNPTQDEKSIFFKYAIKDNNQLRNMVDEYLEENEYVNEYNEPED